MAELLGGRYRVLSVAGRGGEASVLQAVDTRHDRPVALKVRLVPGDDATAEVQLTEARRLLSLPAHDGLAHARDDFYDNGRHVLVLDWVDGIDLARLLSDEGSPGLPVASVLRWLAQAAEALTALHRHGVVHGDVKPANLILDQQGRVVVVDLGSSSVPGDLGPGTGTPGFRAPELAAGEPPTRACDVYGLAATAFALLTGSAPAGVLPDWERLVPGSAQVLEDAIRAGLSVAPERRPATPGELVERLRAGVEDRVPTGVVTVLLTDVVESTELWQRIPAQMPGVLARMQLAVDAAVDHHNGVRLGATVEGDSTVSGFARADDAVGAAVALQRALRRSDPARPTLSVRAGLATGEVVAVGSDVIGPTLSRAARVRDLAGAGEVFLSETTFRVVAPALPAGIELVPLGLHALRGIEGHDNVHAVAADGVATPPDPYRSPYPGLAPFGIDDAAYYVGREELIADALRRLRDDGFVGLVGASGTGKSSLALAGLGPRLAADGDTLAVVTPGAHPLAALDAARAPVDGVLVVNQLEEVVTLCRDRDERAAFLEHLADRTGGTVVTLRSDVYGALAGHGSFSSVLAANHLLVGSPSSEDLQRAIVEPAARCGLRADPGLVDVVLAELGDEPGRLPLLAHALRETWERREGRNLTLAGYRAAGGVEGAIAHTADAIVDAMADDQRKVARWALLEMVELRDDGDDTRRWLALGDVDPARRERAAEALDALAAARLVVIEADRATLAHEALLSAWPRLRAWIDEERAGLVARQHVRRAAAAWVDGGRGSADLYRGARLAGALDAVGAAGGAELSPDVGEFLAASRANEELELAGARRTTRRLRALLAGVSVFAVVALIAGSLAVRAASRARTEATAADARRVGAQALVTDDVDLSLLLAVEGVRLDDSPDTRANMLAALSRSPQVVASARGDEPVITVAVSPDGHLVAAGDPFAGIRFLDGNTLELVGQYPEPPSNLVFRPQGDQLALTANTFAVNSAGTGTLDPEPLVLVDPVTFERHATRLGGLPEGEVSAWAVDYSGDGRFLAASFDRYQGEDVESTVLVWDLGAPERPVARLETGKAVMAIRLSRDGSQLFVVTLEQPAVVVFDVETGEALRSAEGAPSLASWEYLELSPDGTVVAVIDGADIALLDAGTLEETGRLRGHSETVQSIEFANDGRTLVSGSADRVAIVWDVQSREPRERLVGHAGVIRAVGIDPAGATVFTGSLDRSVLSWDLVGRRRFVPRTHVVEPGFATLGIGEAIEGVGAGVALPAPGGRAVAFLENEGGGATRIQFLDAATGALGEAIDSGHGELGGAAWHPGLSRLATTGSDGVVRVWDARTEDVVAESEVAASHVSALDYSDDGRRIVFAQQPIVAAVDAETLEPVGRPVRLEQQVLGVFAGVDGTTALVVTDAPTVTLVDLARGTVVHEIDPGFAPWQADFAPDGGHAALAAFTGEVAVVDLETGELLGPPAVGHKETVISVSYSPDGDLFVTAGRDGRVALWDGRSGDPLGSVTPGRPNSGPNAEFLPDGRTVLIATRDGAVHTWDTSVEHWLDFACGVAGRNLTTEEWRDAFDDRPFRQTCPPR